MSIKKVFFILACVCILTYANSLNNKFVSDDFDSIPNNPLIAEPSHYWLFPSNMLNSFAYLISKFNPVTYHLVSILSHMIATSLVFLFLRFFFKQEASLLGALLFATMAIHTEAVTWISGRPYIITAVFLLVGYFLYHYAADSINPLKADIANDAPLYFARHPTAGKSSRIAAYALCLLIFLYYLWDNFFFYFAFPIFLMLSDVSFRPGRKKWRWQIALKWLPFFAAVCLRLALAKSTIDSRIADVARDAGSAGASWSSPLEGIHFNMVYSLTRHIGLLIWPGNLTLYHEPPVILVYQLVLGTIALGLVLIALPVIYRKSRELFFAILLFVIFLGPTFSPVMVSWLLAERYLYFPSIALSITSAYFYEKYACKNKRIREIALGIFLFVIAANAARAVARNQDWKSPERLWRQTVLASPLSPRAHNNMGDVYGTEGNIEGALQEFKTSVTLKPDYSDGFHNLANTYQRQGNFTEAVKYYKLAVTFNPLLGESYFNLGVIYLNRQEYDPAIESFRKVCELWPNDQSVKSALDIAIKRKNNAK